VLGGSVEGVRQHCFLSEAFTLKGQSIGLSGESKQKTDVRSRSRSIPPSYVTYSSQKKTQGRGEHLLGKRVETGKRHQGDVLGGTS